MLENYYQNVRRYDKSRDYDQLLGGTSDYLSSECEPYRYHKKSNNLNLKYAPCGAVANSKFNGGFIFINFDYKNLSINKFSKDTFRIYVTEKLSNEKIILNISKTNLAWDSDRKYKFLNPPGKFRKYSIGLF